MSLPLATKSNFQCILSYIAYLFLFESFQFLLVGLGKHHLFFELLNQDFIQNPKINFKGFLSFVHLELEYSFILVFVRKAEFLSETCQYFWKWTGRCRGGLGDQNPQKGQISLMREFAQLQIFILNC